MKSDLGVRTQKEGLLFFLINLKETAGMAGAVMIKKGKLIPLSAKSSIGPRNKT